MSVYIPGMEMPKGETSYVELQVWGDGAVYKRQGLAGKFEQIGTAIPLPKKHGGLVERKDMSNFPDYREVRKGLNSILKQTKRDNRSIAGMPIELLQQAIVALDSLRSVHRYFKEAKTIIEAEDQK